MNTTIESILNDLYTLDPELKKAEKNLIPLLERLLGSKPDVKPDEQFIAHLKNQLMAHADELMSAEKPATISWFSRILTPLMGGTMALAALVIGLMVWNGKLGIIQKHEPVLQETPIAEDTVLPIPLSAEPTPEPVPAPKAVTVKKPALKVPEIPEKNNGEVPEAEEAPASSPMMLRAEPALDEGEGETAEPALAQAPALKSTDTASAGISNVEYNPASIILSALRRAQAGERKITASSKQIGQRSPQELMAINFDDLPEGFVEIPDVLPSGYRAYEDQTGTWVDGGLEYYIYFEKTYQWYGPFWSEAD